MNIKDLIEESHGRAYRKGFYDPVPSLESRVALIHSELSEALECYRDNDMTTEVKDGKPVGLPTEIADVVIRICDYAGFAKINLEHLIEDLRSDEAIDLDGDSSLESWLCHMHAELGQGFAYHYQRDDIDYLHDSMAMLVIMCEELAKHLRIDLDAEIRRKSDYNETRPAKHGRVRL